MTAFFHWLFQPREFSYASMFGAGFVGAWAYIGLGKLTEYRDRRTRENIDE